MLRITLILLTLLVVAQLHFKYHLPALLLYYYLVINLFTFALYCYDKSAARKGNWRIKELHLHLLSLFGGWWGALIAQQFIRHKSIKKKFLVVFSLTLLVNVGLLSTAFIKGLI